MTAKELYSYLRGKNVDLWVDGDRLRYRGPKGAVTQALRKELAERKSEILAILSGENTIGSSTVPPIQSISRNKELPLSFSQERFWFLHEFEPDNPAYNIPLAVRLKGRLNIKALEQSFNEIVRRHEILRTTCTTANGKPVQVIAPQLTLMLPAEDLREFPKSERETEAIRFASKEALLPFNLAQDPLLRVTLLRLDEQDHVLLMTTHHFVADGWSIRVLHRELTALYEAFSTGSPSPLSDPHIQYADFAFWQRQWMQGEVLENQLAYWKKQLAGAPMVLGLPFDRPRPAFQTYQGATQSFIFQGKLSEALRALSRREGVTLFMMLLAAFKILLYRYTHQNDIIVGTAGSVRNHIETEGLIGTFANNLPLRTDFSGSPTFRDLLRQVREVALGAFAHQDLPFEKLIEELQPERNLSHTPVFQVMLNFHQTTLLQNLKLPDLSLSSLPLDNKIATFDLTLTVVEGADGLKGTWEYNTHLFEAATIARMLKHFQVLLEDIVADPDASITELPLLTEDERQQVLVGWNATESDYPSESCLHQLFEAQAQRTLDLVAVTCEKTQLTYQELNQRANQLAHYLQALGVGPDVFVGIFVDRSAEMLIGLLGILKAGGAYVPLDPDYPTERLAYMMENAEVQVLIAQEHLKTALPDNKARVICLDADWEEIARQSEANPVSGIKPDNLAYVIYTSGSTGKPKGVQVPHRAVVNFLTSMSRELGLTEQDVLLAVTTLSFDIHVLELYLPLIVGAKTVVASRAVASDGMQLLEALKSSDVTVMQATPSTWRLLLAGGWKGSDRLKILCGGEAFPRDLARELLTRSASVWNMYGPTETTVWSTCYELKDPDGPILIGKPIANTTCYILDDKMQPVPIGVPGELYIGGAGVTQGYLKRPNLNAKQFVPDLFSDDPNARFYRTGDLCRYRADGNIEYLNRIDNQVKVRGFRIELGEIETVLGEHETVGQCVVTVRENRPGDSRLIACIIPKPDRNVTDTELRQYMRTKLPEYMIPQHFVETDALPLTPAGKIDRKELAAELKIGAATEGEYVAPRNETEELLTTIWREVLGVDRVSIHDNFFDIGGHSLLATQVLSRVKRLFLRKLDLRQFFQAPTIKQLASILDQNEISPSLSSLVLLQDGGIDPPFYCVPGMLGNVFMDLSHLVRHLGPNQRVYGLQDGIGLPSKVEALATYFIDEIRGVQPKGPYFLGGVCFGAALAFEMAQQLRNQKQEVGLLALVEPTFPSISRLRTYARLTAFILGMFIRRVGHHSRNVSQLSLDEKKVYLRLRMKIIANLLALANYVPRSYPGHIHLFLTRESLASSRNPFLGWRNLAIDGADIHEIPGTHNTITGFKDTPIEEAHMQALAKKLKDCMDSALPDKHRPSSLGSSFMRKYYHLQG